MLLPCKPALFTLTPVRFAGGELSRQAIFYGAKQVRPRPTAPAQSTLTLPLPLPSPTAGARLREQFRVPQPPLQPPFPR